MKKRIILFLFFWLMLPLIIGEIKFGYYNLIFPTIVTIVGFYNGWWFLSKKYINNNIYSPISRNQYSEKTYDTIINIIYAITLAAILSEYWTLRIILGLIFFFVYSIIWDIINNNED